MAASKRQSGKCRPVNKFADGRWDIFELNSRQPSIVRMSKGRCGEDTLLLGD